MTRVLAVSDEVDEALYGEKLKRLRPDLIVSCGDLPFDYLEHLVSLANVPLLYVPGNHDASLKDPDSGWGPLNFDSPAPGPKGCTSVDGRIVAAAGLRVLGLGGSVRYKEGPNQYTQQQMRRRVLRLLLKARIGRALGDAPVDIVIAHSPPLGCGGGEDFAHQGFEAHVRLVSNLKPRLFIHGHVHPYGRKILDRQLGDTLVVNAVPTRLLEV